jgi:hypothetical protein
MDAASTGSPLRRSTTWMRPLATATAWVPSSLTMSGSSTPSSWMFEPERGVLTASVVGRAPGRGLGGRCTLAVVGVPTRRPEHEPRPSRRGRRARGLRCGCRRAAGCRRRRSSAPPSTRGCRRDRRRRRRRRRAPRAPGRDDAAVTDDGGVEAGRSAGGDEGADRRAHPRLEQQQRRAGVRREPTGGEAERPPCGWRALVTVTAAVTATADGRPRSRSRCAPTPTPASGRVPPARPRGTAPRSRRAARWRSRRGRAARRDAAVEHVGLGEQQRCEVAGRDPAGGDGVRPAGGLVVGQSAAAGEQDAARAPPRRNTSSATTSAVATRSAPPSRTTR